MWGWRHCNVCWGQDIYWQAVVTAQHHSGRWSLCGAIRRCCWSQIGFFSELPAASGYRQASSRDWWGHQQYLQTRGVKGKKKTYMNSCNILQNKQGKKELFGSLTHDLGCRWCSNDDGKIRGNEWHSGLYILIYPVFGLVQLQSHVTCFLQLLQFILT